MVLTDRLCPGLKGFPVSSLPSLCRLRPLPTAGSAGLPASTGEDKTRSGTASEVLSWFLHSLIRDSLTCGESVSSCRARTKGDEASVPSRTRKVYLGTGTARHTAADDVCGLTHQKVPQACLWWTHLGKSLILWRKPSARESKNVMYSN